jgi:hypothetical protein
VVLTASRRLPGIRFEAQPPPPEDVLPRMDIAGFVGFAASGPVGVPVAIEDASEFARVFGADAPLAWDDVRGEPVLAYLAPAVRAFLRNGGQRCWVVRAAGADAATARFELQAVAGLRLPASKDAPASLEPALLQAASPGSWADGLTLTTAVAATPLRFEHVDVGAGRLAVVVGRGDEVVAGDLIRLRVAGTRWALLFVAATVEPAQPASPAATDGALRLDVGWSLQVWLGPAELHEKDTGSVTYLGPDGAQVQAAATVAGAVDTDPEDVVRLALDDATPSPRSGGTLCGTFSGRQCLIEVTAVEVSQAGAVVVGSAASIDAGAPSPAPALPHGGVAERLGLELRVQGPGRAPVVLSDLGFAAAHPRFAGALLDDAARYAQATGPDGLETTRAGAGDGQRLVGPGGLGLAGPDAPPACLLPFAGALRAGRALPALRRPGDARTRDGLERFDPTLFVDVELAGRSTGALVETANWLRDHGPAPRPLRGIHALVDNEEVTIVAVPDGVHRPWYPAASGTPAPPVAAAPQEPLDWSRFRDCGAQIPSAPALSLGGDPRSGVFTLSWTATDAAGATYELQESTEPDFTPAETMYSGPGRTLDLHDRPSGFALYYQVRAVAATSTSDWSNRLLVRTAPAERGLLDDPAVYDPAPLVELQLAMLRMCAARGDMLAVLALPEHYRGREAVTHPAALEAASQVGGGGGYGRDPMFGFGALYHPWLHASASDGSAGLRLLPPDGAAAGVLADRAARRGAWVAPANEPLRDVLALEPEIAPEDRQALQDAQVNLVRHEPGGFLWLAADTLSGDGDVRSIGVRRLLQTVRRLALRHGDLMAFEPNDAIARRAVRRSFQTLLGRMFELGAFAGRAPDEGFRVDTPSSAADRDHGRLVVELRVAPAHPLAFLTVRLVRTGAGKVSVDGR